MSFRIAGAPGEVVAAIERLQAELKAAAGANLAGLVLFGGLARGRYRPGRSDVNLIVLLHEMSAAALTAVAPALRAASRAISVEPLMLTPREIPAAVEAFPTKFLDLVQFHIVLLGDDPFVGIEVAQDQLLQRSAQELHNLLMRLRRRYVAASDDPARMASVLAEVSRPFALILKGLLRAAGKEIPADDRTANLFAAAAAAFQLPGEPLAQLAALRQDIQATRVDGNLFGGVLDAVSRAAAAADEMRRPSE